MDQHTYYFLTLRGYQL